LAKPQRLKPIPLRRYQAFALPTIGRAKARLRKAFVAANSMVFLGPLQGTP
jgi:hypothetical protein